MSDVQVEMKKDCWSITVLKRSIDTVVFDEEVTYAEAVQKYLNDDIEDVMEEETLEILGIGVKEVE